MPPPLARHSGESRNPAPCSVVSRKCRASTRPAGERVTFFACAKKVTKESTPQAARSPGILPSEFASALRGSLSAHPCARNELARIVRATLRAFPPRTRRAAWGPIWAASCRRSNHSPSLLLRQLSGGANDRTDAVQGCTGSCTTGAVRGAEHRRLRGISPKGRGDGSPRSRSSTGTVLSERPREDEKRRAVRFARCESDRRVRCLAFLVTFWAMPKSNRLAAGETKLCTSTENTKQGAGFRLSPE